MGDAPSASSGNKLSTDVSMVSEGAIFSAQFTPRLKYRRAMLQHMCSQSSYTVSVQQLT